MELNSSEGEQDVELPSAEEAENATEAATATPVLREDTIYEIMAETPIGAERPPSPPECNECLWLSTNLKCIQKENSYLRKRNWQLKDQL